MKNILRDRQLPIKLKTRLLKCFVWPVLMYGCETWKVTTKTRKNFEAAEMWFFRSSVVQRFGDARGDCLIGCPTTKF